MEVDALGDNSQLMPIGGANLPVDAAPVQVRLDQVSVDREIANLQEELKLPSPPATNSIRESTDYPTIKDSAAPPADDSKNRPVVADKTTHRDETGDQVTSSPTKQGRIEMKEYGIKHKPDNDKLKFKCVKCEFRSKTRKEVNKHYVESHEPLMCEKCSRLFNTPSSLSLHMYDHEEHRYKCEVCSKGYHFKGQLKQHKADHHKTPSFQCM